MDGRREREEREMEIDRERERIIVIKTYWISRSNPFQEVIPQISKTAIPEVVGPVRKKWSQIADEIAYTEGRPQSPWCLQTQSAKRSPKRLTKIQVPPSKMIAKG